MAAASRDATIRGSTLAVAVERTVARRRGRFSEWLVVLALLLAAPALAAEVKAAAPGPGPDAMKLIEQYPRAHQLMSGSGVAFALGFDRPLDHAASRFTLVAPDGRERTIRLRLNAQPNTLYASVGHLEPGGYELRWQARAADGQALSGAFPFMVGTAAHPGAIPPQAPGTPAHIETGT
jgi:methionine-rich copper-binding protein CopC